MPALAYFKHAVELMKVNPPHFTDWSMVARLKRIGIEVGRATNRNVLIPPFKRRSSSAAADGLKAMRAKLPKLAKLVNGWQMITDTIGVYGDFYLKRAIVAQIGLGANQPEDAVYPLVLTDADGKRPTGDNSYVLHFSKDGPAAGRCVLVADHVRRRKGSRSPMRSTASPSAIATR